MHARQGSSMTATGSKKPYSVAIISFKPGYGHIQPLLKVADALSQAGFTIRCYLAEECASLMTRFNFDYVLFESTHLEGQRKVMVRKFARGLFFNRFIYYVHYLLLYPAMIDVASRAVQPLKQELSDQQPDVIICDPHWVGEWCPRIAAFFNVPLIINNLDGNLQYNQREFVQLYGVTTVPPALQRVVELAGSACNKLCRIYYRLRYIRTWLKLRTAKRTATRAFETAFPLSSRASAAVRRIVVGTAPIERARLGGLIKTEGADYPEFHPIRFRSAVPLSKDICEWIEGAEGRPIVYVSFGSAVQIDAAFAAAVYRGLQQVSARVLWSLPENQAAVVAKLPAAENIRIESFVPQAEILDIPAVRCFVTHAGPSSVQEGLFGATPMVCIPFFADQGYNSWIVENLRVGRRLWHRNVSPDTISEAVQDILTNADYLCAAQEIRDDLLRNDGGEAVARYVAEICDLRDLSEKSRLRGDGG